MNPYKSNRLRKNSTLVGLNKMGFPSYNKCVRDVGKITN